MRTKKLMMKRVIISKLQRKMPKRMLYWPKKMMMNQTLMKTILKNLRSNLLKNQKHNRRLLNNNRSLNRLNRNLSRKLIQKLSKNKQLLQSNQQSQLRNLTMTMMNWEKARSLNSMKMMRKKIKLLKKRTARRRKLT